MAITIENIIKEEFSVNGVKIIPINNHKYIFISKMDFNSLKIKNNKYTEFNNALFKY